MTPSAAANQLGENASIPALMPPFRLEIQAFARREPCYITVGHKHLDPSINREKL